MHLLFDTSLADKYKSNTQIARVLSENWVLKNAFCPSCGYKILKGFPNNNPAGDFFCLSCKADYELKSTKSKIDNRIVDGAYNSMVSKIINFSNPHFFFLQYYENFSVKNFFVIPKYFFITDIIEKRKPLGINARRAGWLGCNILIGSIPLSGRIFLVKNESIISPKDVIKQWEKVSFLSSEKLSNRGWLLEMISIVEKIPKNIFTLSDIYAYNYLLEGKFPRNKFIKEKIRQQLQVLRDKGFINFIDKGTYQKI